MKKKMSGPVLTWLGHAAFHVRTPGGKTILIDPWISNPRAPQMVSTFTQANFIVVTHGHGDHLGETVSLARSSKATVLAMYEIITYLTKKGIPTGVGMNKGGSYVADGIRFTMVDAKHSSSIDDNGVTIPGGEAAGFVMELEDGSVLYHAGDTSVFSDMVLIGKIYKPTIAMLPIGGLYSMDPREAAVACSLLKPKVIVGMHYGTYPALAGTPAALRKALAPEYRKRVVELMPGISREF